MSNTPKGWQDREISHPAPSIDLGAFIGRFQFFHEGHRDAAIQGLQRVGTLAILVGSSNQPRTYYNPWTFEERQRMIMASIPPELRSRVICLPLEDSTYNDTAWMLGVQEQVEEARNHFGLPVDAKIGLVGHKKDGTGYYLNMFPQWAEVAVKNNLQLSATPLRSDYFLTDKPLPRDLLPEPVIDFLAEFKRHADFDRIRDEYLHVEEYSNAYATIDTSRVPKRWLARGWVQTLLSLLRAKPKYAPIFVTVDACVVQSGHVLLVQRKAMPGRGLWALPGGFLESHERIEDAIYRELIEETSIEVPEGILRGRTEEIRVFDAVHRSSRGRTITHCALIALKTPSSKSGVRVKLPKVKGQREETTNVKWWPLAGPGAITPDIMFEDHYSVIKRMTSKL
jgi:bifunctional NMN adenylyltransferase/nudix hydrolase